MSENGNKSRASRTSGKRACLCKDGTYKRKCCTGELQNQGIGSDVTPPQPVPPAPNWNPLP
jgi:hypothetical protein